MSYLDRPRLTFFGQFTANPSTINNLPVNYKQPLPYVQSASDPGGVSWNPYGRHNFSIDDCAVTNLVMDGHPGEVHGTVSTAQAGALVDLDTQQQIVSQIIGMKLTVTVGGGWVSGTFMAVNFVDFGMQRTQGSSANVGADGAMGAAYQSVLTGLTWNESGSPFLQALKAVSPTMLSIRMNVDAYHGISGAPQFKTGRVAGTIGPCFKNEPLTFTNARFLRPLAAAYNIGGWNAVPAKLDAKRRKLIVDLGNATPWTWNSHAADPTSSVQSVQVAAMTFHPNSHPPAPQGIHTIGPADDPTNVLLPQPVDTSDAAYRSNAFVQELDVPESMLSAIASQPLGIISGGTLVITENPSGAYVNAEPYVFRLNPGDKGEVTLWANTFQKPAASTKIALVWQNSWLEKQKSGGPDVATPPEACSFPDSVTTDAQGKATFTIKARDPKNPRGAIDGQVYGVGWKWDLDLLPDQWSFISVKIFDRVRIPRAPTWWDDVFPILVQYAYLYPAMQKVLMIDEYDAVVPAIKRIIYQLTLPDDDAAHMPVTRELSADKLAILLKWANNPKHPQGKVPVPPPVLPPWPPEPATSGSGQ